MPPRLPPVPGKQWASRTLGILSATLLVLMFLGCMSFSVGGRTYQESGHEGIGEDGLYLQRGEVHLPSYGEQDVYYAAPYAHPPNLVLTDNDDCMVTDQQPDHFRVRNKSLLSQDVSWRARGVRLASAEIPTVAVPSVPTDTLPALPVPAPLRSPSAQQP